MQPAAHSNLKNAMQTYETIATVKDEGQVTVAGVPFAPGTEVEISMSPKRRAADDFIVAWTRICAELRSRPGAQNIEDDEIREQIDRYRAGQ